MFLITFIYLYDVICLYLLNVYLLFFFLFYDTYTTEIYTYCHTLALHDALPIFCSELVFAAVVRLLDLAALRVGNEEYALANRSFGATTLRQRQIGRAHV